MLPQLSPAEGGPARCSSVAGRLCRLTIGVSLTVILLLGVEYSFWSLVPVLPVEDTDHSGRTRYHGKEVSVGSSGRAKERGKQSELARRWDNAETFSSATLGHHPSKTLQESTHPPSTKHPTSRPRTTENLWNKTGSSNSSVQTRLPNCLIIGVRKGGTRALLEFLSLHPSVRVHPSEMHFFSDERQYSLSLDWYRSNMPPSLPHQVTIEKTPAYFVDEQVPRRVQAMNSSIKLILVVRDPVERAISDYNQMREIKERRGQPAQSFENHVLGSGGDGGRVNEGSGLIQRSVYHFYLAQWLRHFPLRQFHFVSGERLIKDPVSELRQVESFLGLPARFGPDFIYFNSTRGFYCMRKSGNSIGEEGGATEKCLDPSKGRTHTNVSQETRAKLRNHFRPHNERFYSMVGRDFGWIK